MTIVFLGCGSSGGVPTILDHWGNCEKTEKNRRTRSCLYVSALPRNSIGSMTENFSFLVDAGPDIRFQCLRENIQDVHGVLCTHSHYDHVGGLEDLKHFALKNQCPLPLWCTEETLKSLQNTMGHIFYEKIFDPWESLDLRDQNAFPKNYKKAYHGFCEENFQNFFHPDRGRQPFLFFAVVKKKSLINNEFYPFFLPLETPLGVLPMEHSHNEKETFMTLGFHFGSWAYSTDLYKLKPENLRDLKDVPLWIVDCLSLKPNFAHGHLEKTLEWIHRIGAKRAILTHMNGEMDYGWLQKNLPPHVSPAHDGRKIDI